MSLYLNTLIHVPIAVSFQTKLENGGASIPDLPAMLSPPPVEGSKGLLKWKGVVFSPDESEEHMDKIKPPLAFSVSSNGDEVSRNIHYY